MALEILTKISPFALHVVKKSTKIYASQLYETFFAVGAKLNLENGDTELASMDLTLVNYKGLYNLGMSDLTKISFSSDGKLARLKLHLSAFTGIHGNDKVLKLNFSNKDLSKLETMNVTRKLHSFSNHSNADMTNHLYDNCFDNEFYERDGAAIVERVRMDDKIEEYNKNKVGPKADVGGVCRTSTIVFVG